MGENAATKQVAFGKEAMKEFLFDPTWRNLNHGSFGTIPRAIQNKQRHYQDLAEARPDEFIRRDYPNLLDESRAAVAELVNAPVDDVVLVSNATTAVNTIYKNMTWNDDGKDTILSFSTIYGGCGKTEDWIVDNHQGKVSIREMDLVYPLEDEDIIQLFRDTVKQVESEGKRARICLFDVVSSSPGVFFPWVSMAKACRELGVLSLVDGAQGVGMVHLDIQAADPDFFLSNCHKWLHVPRGCAFLYVAKRNQHMITSAIQTSHAYISQKSKRPVTVLLKSDHASQFVNIFSFVGTMDNAPFACVKDSIAWRRDVLGGEEKIISYITKLSKEGSKYVAKEVGGVVLDNKKGTMTNCAMATIMLPLWVGERGDGAGADDIVVSKEDAPAVFQWLDATQVTDYNTFMAFSVRWERFTVRLSAQVYLDMEDYEFAAKTIKDLLARVAKGEYKQ